LKKGSRVPLLPYNYPVRWYTVVDEMYVDEMSVDELSWNPKL